MSGSTELNEAHLSLLYTTRNLASPRPSQWVVRLAVAASSSGSPVVTTPAASVTFTRVGSTVSNTADVVFPNIGYGTIVSNFIIYYVDPVNGAAVRLAATDRVTPAIAYTNTGDSLTIPAGMLVLNGPDRLLKWAFTTEPLDAAYSAVYMALHTTFVPASPQSNEVSAAWYSRQPVLQTQNGSSVPAGLVVGPYTLNIFNEIDRNTFGISDLPRSIGANEQQLLFGPVSGNASISHATLWDSATGGNFIALCGEFLNAAKTSPAILPASDGCTIRIPPDCFRVVVV